MSRFDSFCASCGYQLTKDGEGWTGCQCAKLAELDARGVNIVDLDEENTRLRAALAGIAALEAEEPKQATGYEADIYYYEEKGRFEAAEMARVALGESK